MFNNPLKPQHSIPAAAQVAANTGKPGICLAAQHTWEHVMRIYPHIILEEEHGFIRASFEDIQPAQTGKTFAGKTLEIHFE